MAKIIAITNQKGGVGKTTTCINLAASLVATKRSVLLIDMDPQGNTTMGSGVNKYQLEKSCCDVLLDNTAIAEVTLAIEASGYSLVPANADMTAAEVQLVGVNEGQRSLQRALEQEQQNYDYTIIDCPPTLNMLTVNALVAADGIIIPIQCEYYALEGLTALLDTIIKIRTTYNPGLQVEGILRTMFDPRNRLSNDVSNQLVTHFGDKVFRTLIPRNVRLAEAPSHGLPALQYEKTSRGAIAYLALAGEILRKETKDVTI